MSGQRKRRGGGGSGPRKWVWIALGGLGLLLAANLVVALPSWADGGDPSGWLTPDILLRVGLWVPVGVTGVFAAGGMIWTTRAMGRSGRPGMAWGRFGFGFAIMSLVGLLAAIFDPESFPRETIIPLFLMVFAVETFLFAQMIRLMSGGGSRGRGGSRGGSREEHADGDAFADPVRHRSPSSSGHEGK